MEVIIDGKPGYVFETPPADILGGIAEISDTMKAQGKAVLAITVDGASVAPDAIVDTLEGRTPEDTRRLEITTADNATLVREALDDLQEVLPDLPEACHRLAEVFQSEQPEAGFEPFERLAEIWSTIKTREGQIASALDIDLSQLSLDGKSIAEVHEALNGFLDEAAGALKSNDCILLGDLLEYELAPKAEEEARIAALLRSQAETIAG